MDREPLEDRRRLKLARDAHFGAPHYGKPSDIPALEPHASGGRRQMAGDHADEGRLAGTVWPDHTADLASIEREVDVVIGEKPAESLGKAFRAQQLSHGRPPLASP